MPYPPSLKEYVSLLIGYKEFAVVDQETARTIHNQQALATEPAIAHLENEGDIDEFGLIASKLPNNQFRLWHKQDWDKSIERRRKRRLEIHEKSVKEFALRENAINALTKKYPITREQAIELIKPMNDLTLAEIAKT